MRTLLIPLPVALWAAAAIGVPAAASVTITDLVEITDVDSVSVSPDGRFAVFRTEQADLGRNSYILRWHSVDLTTGTVRDIGSGGDPIYTDPGWLPPEKVQWTSDNRSIIVRALVDGAIGLWCADVGGRGTRPLAVADADVIDFSMAPDRSAVLYSVGAARDEIQRAERREYDDGVLVDRTVDLAQGLFRGGSVNGRMASQRLVGYWWVRDGLLWQAPRQQRRIDLQTGRDVTLGEPKAVPPFDPATVTQLEPPAERDGDVAASGGTGSQHWVAVTFRDGRKIRCADPLCASAAPSSIAWRPASNELIVTFKDRELRQSLYAWNTDTNRLRPIAAADGLLNGGRHYYQPCAIGAAAAVCVSSGPASPPRVESVDLATGARKTLFDPNDAMRAAYRPAVRFMRWSIGDGLEAAGVLMLPPHAGRRPAPLYINYYLCDGFLRGGEGDEWPMPQLIDAGYAVACINSVPFTGHQDGVRNYEVGLKAVGALIDKLAAEGTIDRTRVAMGGLSFGSETAFWIAMHSHLLAALSVSSEQPEPGSYWFGAMPGSDIVATRLKVWGYGKPDQTPARWRVVSPALNTDKIRIPVLLQLPEQEARAVPELYARLYEQGTPTELYAFPDEAHIKLQPRHRLAVYERNLDWFRYWLEDYRDPDLEKREQYRRWDALRRRWTPAQATATTGATAPSPPSR